MRWFATKAISTSVSDAIRRTIRQMSNQQIIYDVTTMESIVADTLASRRFVMVMLAAFAALALLLASIGIYGVIAYIVGQRTQEIGIRMALGARRFDVLRLMLWEGMRLALIGVIGRNRRRISAHPALEQDALRHQRHRPAHLWRSRHAADA